MNVERMTKTRVFETVDSLRFYLSEENHFGSIGFVPTMGALHDGHISLVKQAEQNCEVVVVSIFVNPTQFNDANDLEKYPRTLAADLERLAANCECVVFAPNVKEIYPENHVAKRIDLGGLGNVMEGSFREGHFDGVVEVVYRLFDIVRPTHAFFGEKDFQQLAVIRHLVKVVELPIKIIGCPIFRETSGLAASSRNQRLSPEEKEKALIIYHSLLQAKEHQNEWSPKEAKEKIQEAFDASDLELEYIDFVDATTLASVAYWTKDTQGCLAAYCGSVRLIDNLSMA